MRKYRIREGSPLYYARLIAGILVAVAALSFAPLGY